MTLTVPAVCHSVAVVVVVPSVSHSLCCLCDSLLTELSDWLFFHRM